nr:CPBP family intramembrane metalloprotease [candidate division Zixibacteria bacterium]
MTSINPTRIIITLLVGTVIAVAAILLPKYFMPSGIPSLVTTQSLELVLSLLAIIIMGKGKFSEYGFRMPKTGTFGADSFLHWLGIGLAALAIGALATGAILLSGAGGNPLAKRLSFPQIVLFVWILSSLIEEIFTRGFLQGHLEKAADIKIRLMFFRVDLAALLSALFFACLHLVLIKTGADPITIVITLLFTFSLGLLAAQQRSITGSLLPAVGVHLLGNIGGVIGGMIYMIISFLTGGTLPKM